MLRALSERAELEDIRRRRSAFLAVDIYAWRVSV